MTASRITPEDPARLRDCLTALAQAAATDVTRCQLLSENGQLRIIVTSSRLESEERIAQLIGDRLQAWLDSFVVGPDRGGGQ